MLAKVVAVTPDEFKTYLETKKREIEANNKAAQTRREQEAKDTAQGESPTEEANPQESESPSGGEGS
jgi:heme/copper-type cytochrome/quinol oxidase subunit 2